MHVTYLFLKNNDKENEEQHKALRELGFRFLFLQAGSRGSWY